MKLLKNYRLWLVVVLTPLLVVMCMTIEDVVHPSDAQPDSEITIQVKLKFVSETDRQSPLAFGILAPKAWNLGQNAKLTLTTTALYAPNQVTDEPLTLIPSSQLNPTTGTSWAASFQSRFGVLENYKQVEWVVFESKTNFLVHDNVAEQKNIEGTVTIKFTTGPENLKVNMGYAFCGKAYGFSSEEYPKTDVVVSKVLEVGDQSSNLSDYTVPSPVSTVPAVFGYGDIFSINFREQVSALKGATEVYMQATVIYDGGKEKTVYEKSAKTLMEKIGDDLWQRYIYPSEYFDLPAGTVIEEIRLHLTDKSGVIVDNDGADFVIEDDE